MPRSFLFAIWDGGGAVPPPLSLARALVDRGHTVRVLGDTVLAPEIAAAGAEHIPWTSAPNRRSPEPEAQLIMDHDLGNPLALFARVRDGLICGPARAYADDTRAELRRRPTDVLLADFVLLGAQIAGEAEGVPVVRFASNPLAFRGWGVPPLGPGFAPARGPLGRARDQLVGRISERVWSSGLEPLNAARAAHGLPPMPGVIEQAVGGGPLLLFISAALEYPGFAPPANVRIVGPRLEDPAWAEDAAWTPPPGDDPLVLVALSSTYQGQEDVLRRCVAALGELPVRGVVTTGPSVPAASLSAPANVTVLERAPHAPILREAAAVVTHGGYGTLVKSLAAGVPVVCLPMGRDQLDNASRLVHAGAGVRLKPGAAPARIADAVREVLAGAHAAQAAQLARAIAEETAEDRAVAEVLALAGGRNGREMDVALTAGP